MSRDSEIDNPDDNYDDGRFEHEDSGQDQGVHGDGVSSKGGSILDALKALVSFFTIIKLNVDEEGIRSANKNLYLAPVIGAFIGILALIVTIVAMGMLNYGAGVVIEDVWGDPKIVKGGLGTLFMTALGIAGGAITIASIFIITKFLHFDGLADFGDGMVVSGDKEDHVRALKDTHIGAGGIGLALIVTLLAVALYSGSSLLFATAFIIVGTEIFVKNAMVSAASFGVPGNGMAGDQVRLTNGNSLMKSTLISIVLASVLALILGSMGYIITDVSIFGGRSLLWLILSLILSAVTSIGVGALMARMANKNFGFVNGDVLGATNEIARVAILFMISFAWVMSQL